MRIGGRQSTLNADIDAERPTSLAIVIFRPDASCGGGNGDGVDCLRSSCRGLQFSIP